MREMPSLDEPTEGQRVRAESLAADGYAPEEIAQFRRAEWKVAQRIALDRRTDLQPLTGSEEKLAKQWLSGNMPAAAVAERVLERRREHQERVASRKDTHPRG